MAKHSQHQQGASASKRSGGGQAVVELCDVTAAGVVFWSRQRFDIGSELQIRIRRDALPCHCIPSGCAEEEWVTVSGFVIECPAVRRQDGSPGFKVSLLLDSVLMSTAAPRSLLRPRPVLKYMHTRFSGLKPAGLN